MKRVFKTICFLLVASFVILVLLDYFNCAGLIGLDVTKLNWDFLSIVIGNFVVISLYLTTYFLIDKRNLERNNNQEQSAKIVLREIYSKCEEDILLYDNKEVLERISKKCDFDIPICQDPMIARIKDYPFEYEEIIFTAASNGMLTESEFDSFIKIRNEFKTYVTRRIIFFDAEENEIKNTQNGLLKILREGRASLLEAIKKELKNLEK